MDSAPLSEWSYKGRAEVWSPPNTPKNGMPFIQKLSLFPNKRGLPAREESGRRKTKIEFGVPPPGKLSFREHTGTCVYSELIDEGRTEGDGRGEGIALIWRDEGEEGERGKGGGLRLARLSHVV